MYGHHALLGVAGLGSLEGLIVVLGVDAQTAQGLGVGRPVTPTPAAGFTDAHAGEELQRGEHTTIPADAEVHHERQGLITSVRLPATAAHRWQSISRGLRDRIDLDGALEDGESKDRRDDPDAVADGLGRDLSTSDQRLAEPEHIERFDFTDRQRADERRDMTREARELAIGVSFSDSRLACVPALRVGVEVRARACIASHLNAFGGLTLSTREESDRGLLVRTRVLDAQSSFGVLVLDSVTLSAVVVRHALWK
ncbi:MAG: hypothetical protein JRJ10_13920 [Deltaproteobacteria bacterium]|nr:hypothetical protein [Deltaproteobacteria bacterium]